MKRKFNLFLIAIILVWCQNGITTVFALDDESMEIKLTDGKIYSKITLDDNFLPDSLDVVLTKPSSRNFDKIYTIRDFPEIDCITISDISKSVN